MLVSSRRILTFRAARFQQKRWYASNKAAASYALLRRPEKQAVSCGNNGAASAHRPWVELYQYRICPFCNQTKALLAYSGTEHTVIEVNPLTRREIKWSQDYKKVPLALIDNIPHFGSEKILMGLLHDPSVRHRLESRWKRYGTSPDYWTDFGRYPTAWTIFANDELAPLLYPNMCRTWSDAYSAFGYVRDVREFGPLQRFGIQTVGSLAMYLAASKVKKTRNISDEWQALHDALTFLETEGLGAGNKFLSKAPEPDLGDLAVYGTLRSIKALPIHDMLVRDRGGLLREWYARMLKSVEYPYTEE